MEKYGESSIKFSLEQLNIEKEENKLQEILYGICFSSIFAFAVIYSIIAAFGVSVNHLLIIGVTLAVAILLNIFCNMKMKIVYGAIPLIAAFIGHKVIFSGMTVIGNSILEYAGAMSGVIYNPFALAESAGSMEISVALTVLGIWAVLLGCHIVRETNCVAAGFAAAILLLIDKVFPCQYGQYGTIPVAMAAVVFVSAWIKNFIEQGYMGRSLQKLFGRTNILIISGVMAAVMILSLLSGSLLEAENTLSKNLRNGINSAVESARYGSNDERAMPLGNFEGLGALEPSDEEMLEVKSDNLKSYYLRGFTGGTYTGNGWEPAEGETLYERADVFYWLHEDGFFGQSQIAKSAQILRKDTEETVNLTIKNTGADTRFYYAPYETTAITDNNENILKSSMLREDSFYAESWSGSDEYRVETLSSQIKYYPDMISELTEQLNGKTSSKVSDYIAAESHYNNFVYENYLQIPERTERLIEKGLSAAGEIRKPQTGKAGYKEAKEATLSFLNKAVEYSTETEEYTGDTDFIEEFLTETRAGYSVHYATTAVMVLRYYGIPARYVEGYLLTPNDVKASQETGEVILTDAAAHAWVEYYQDGIGWIPFEVTPAYMDVMEQPEETVAEGNPYESESESSNSLGLEMKEDNFEKEEEKDVEEEQSVPVQQLLIAGGIILLLLVAVGVIGHLIRRFMKLTTLRKSFESENKSEAVISLFAYIITLHEAVGIKKTNQSIYQYADDVERIAGSDMALRYEETAKLYQKAAYSRYEPDDIEKNCVKEYKDAVIAEIKKQNAIKRFKLKWIKGIY